MNIFICQLIHVCIILNLFLCKLLVHGAGGGVKNEFFRKNVQTYINIHMKNYITSCVLFNHTCNFFY